MKKINVGIIGLGRLGIEHAKNIAFNIPNAVLLAACSLDDRQLETAKTEFSIKYVYSDYECMIKNREIDAVAIISPSNLHCKHIRLALESGLHVFCEKPLGMTVAECLEIEKIIEKFSDKIFFLGFMRRFDPSYQYAKKLILEGKIGKPILFRGYSQDPRNTIKDTLLYMGHSGGTFFDMSVHDIDMARWLIGSNPKEVWAMGGCYIYNEFSKYNDGDNVAAFFRFENSVMGFMFAGRTAAHGYNVETEIIGTDATLRIGSVPQKNLVEILDECGVRRECSKNFLERFENAYLNEMSEFINCIVENRQPDIKVADGTITTKVAEACQISFESNKIVSL